jgi:hypothetical protein
VVGRDDDMQGACFNHYMPTTLKPDVAQRWLLLSPNDLGKL